MAVDFPTSPTLGQVVAGTGGVSWRWDGAAWVIATGARSAHGVVAYAHNATSQGGITNVDVNLSGLSVSWTADPTRRYRTTVVIDVASTVANDLPLVKIKDASGTQKQRSTTTVPSGAATETLMSSVVETGLSGAQTRYASLVRAVGSGTLTMSAAPDAPAYIMVEDVTYEGASSGGVVPPAPIVVWSNSLTFSVSVAIPTAISPQLNSPTITPRSSFSKFLIRVSLMIGASGCDDAGFFLLRNGALIGNGAGSSTLDCARYHRFSAADNLSVAHINWEYLDSPNTVSAINYCPAMSVRVAGGSQVLYLNRRGDGTSIGGTSSMSIQEIP